jgi:hypothetical protein
MGCESKVQVIQRANKSRPFYLILPAPLAEAMEFQKGERIEWVVLDRRTLEVRGHGQEADARRSTYPPPPPPPRLKNGLEGKSFTASDPLPVRGDFAGLGVRGAVL